MLGLIATGLIAVRERQHKLLARRAEAASSRVEPAKHDVLHRAGETAGRRRGRGAAGIGQHRRRGAHGERHAGGGERERECDERRGRQTSVEDPRPSIITAPAKAKHPAIRNAGQNVSLTALTTT